MRFLGQLFGEVFHLGHKSLDKALHPDSMNRFSNNVLERSKAAFGVEGESLEEFHSAYAVRLASRNLEEQRPLKYQAVLDQAMDQGYGEDQAARIAGQQADAFVQQNFKPLAQELYRRLGQGDSVVEVIGPGISGSVGDDFGRDWTKPPPEFRYNSSAMKKFNEAVQRGQSPGGPVLIQVAKETGYAYEELLKHVRAAQARRQDILDQG